MTPARAALHLTTPPPPAQLHARFPKREYPAGTEVFRSHKHGVGPLWFSNTGEGRFDLADPNGTCYAAEAELTTLLEAWAGMLVVPDYLVAQRDTSRLRLAHKATVADLTSNQAVQYGVTAEIFTTIDYSLTQMWAAALNKAGYDGIRYWASHDLAHNAACLAVFGPAGTPAVAAGLDTLSIEHLPDRPDLLDDLRHETGISILPVPPR